MLIRSPFYRSDLRDNFWLHPLHLFHQLRRDAATRVRGLAVEKIGERACRGVERLQHVEHFSPDVRSETRADFAGEAQLLPS